MFGSGCVPGVAVLEMGEWDRSDAPDEAFCELLPCRWCPNGGVPASDLVATRPLISNGGCRVLGQPSNSTAAFGLQLTFFLCPCGVDLTRFRLLITSVLRLIGRGRPWSLRNRPQALHSTDPISSLRHNGVVEVWQFWQTGCTKEKPLSARVAAISRGS